MTVVLRLKGSDDIAVDESQIDHFRKLGYHAVHNPAATDETAAPKAPRKKAAAAKTAAPTTPASTVTQQPTS